MSARALFLDRDGVINHEVHYAHRADQITFVDGIFSLCRQAKRLGYHLVVVTNQSGISKGLYTEEDFATLTQWIGEQFAREGIMLDATFHSPHGAPHEDHKPSPGMLLRAARTFSLDLAQSVLIGDRCSDIGAANAAGLRQAFLLQGTEAAACEGEYVLITELAQAELWLMEHP